MCVFALQIILHKEDYRDSLSVTGYGFHLQTFILYLGTKWKAGFGLYLQEA